MLVTTTTSEHIGHWVKMRRSLAPFSGLESSVHTRYSADFIITTSAFRSYGEVDSDRRSGRVRLQTLTLETTMQAIADRPEAPSAIRTNLGAIFASLELSHSTWLITSLSPGSGEKMSKHVVHRGDIAWAAAALRSTSRESCSADGPQLSDHRHS